MRTTGRDTAEGMDPSVDHPTHYNAHPSGVECIDIVRHHSFNIGSAIKYLWRDGIKNTETPIQDLEKAIWYIQDEINMRKNNAVQASADTRATDESSDPS